MFSDEHEGEILALLRGLLGQVFRRAASDPKVRAKVGTFTKDEVAPRLAAARDELRDLASESGSGNSPEPLMRRLGRRVAEVNRHRSEDE